MAKQGLRVKASTGSAKVAVLVKESNVNRNQLARTAAGDRVRSPKTSTNRRFVWTYIDGVKVKRFI